MSSVIIARALGTCSVTVAFDEDTLALFVADHAGNEGTPEEHIDAGAAEH
jgi:hypothetical protein